MHTPVQTQVLYICVPFYYNYAMFRDALVDIFSLLPMLSGFRAAWDLESITIFLSEKDFSFLNNERPVDLQYTCKSLQLNVIALN